MLRLDNSFSIRRSVNPQMTFLIPKFQPISPNLKLFPIGYLLTTGFFRGWDQAYSILYYKSSAILSLVKVIEQAHIGMTVVELPRILKCTFPGGAVGTAIKRKCPTFTNSIRC